MGEYEIVLLRRQVPAVFFSSFSCEVRKRGGLITVIQAVFIPVCEGKRFDSTECYSSCAWEDVNMQTHCERIDFWRLIFFAHKGFPQRLHIRHTNKQIVSHTFTEINKGIAFTLQNPKAKHALAT